jgi:hypothetical protein
MKMASVVVGSKVPHRAAFCTFCGFWPATLYKDLGNKMSSPRVCEPCIENKRVVLEDGVYVTNPELPADPEESDR